MSTEAPIVRIEAGDNATVTKVDSPLTWERGYAYPVVYVLSDGTRIASRYKHRLRRDAVAELASLPKAPKHPMTAILDNGRLVGTTTHIRLGPTQ